MLHEWNRLSFWRHHLLAAGITYAILVTVRIGSLPGQMALWDSIAVNAFLQVLVVWPLIMGLVELFGAVLKLPWPMIWRHLAAVSLACALASVFLPIVGWALDVLPPGVDFGATRGEMRTGLIDQYPRRLLHFLASAVPIWFVANYSWYAAREGLAARPKPIETEDAVSLGTPGPMATPGAPRFITKLPPEKRGELWAITAEQHYLRVYTSQGDDLLLMRFADALAELEAHDGLQIHRSHWVAFAGVKGLLTDSKRLYVDLKNDLRLPVSRPNEAMVKARLEEAPSASTKF